MLEVENVDEELSSTFYRKGLNKSARREKRKQSKSWKKSNRHLERTAAVTNSYIMKSLLLVQVTL